MTSHDTGAMMSLAACRVERHGTWGGESRQLHRPAAASDLAGARLPRQQFGQASCCCACCALLASEAPLPPPQTAAAPPHLDGLDDGQALALLERLPRLGQLHVHHVAQLALWWGGMSGAGGRVKSAGGQGGTGTAVCRTDGRRVQAAAAEPDPANLLGACLQAAARDGLAAPPCAARCQHASPAARKLPAAQAGR